MLQRYSRGHSVQTQTGQAGQSHFAFHIRALPSDNLRHLESKRAHAPARLPAAFWESRRAGGTFTQDTREGYRSQLWACRMEHARLKVLKRWDKYLQTYTTFSLWTSVRIPLRKDEAINLFMSRAVGCRGLLSAD